MAINTIEPIFMNAISKASWGNKEKHTHGKHNMHEFIREHREGEKGGGTFPRLSPGGRLKKS